MNIETLIAIVKAEMLRHRFDTYLDNCSETKDNRGVVVPGCRFAEFA